LEDREVKEKGRKAAKFIAEICLRAKVGEHLLVIAENLARPLWMAELVAEAVVSLGAEVTTIIMIPRVKGQLEPPPEIGAAMKVANTIVCFYGGYADIFHTNATKEALAAGSRMYSFTGLSEDQFVREFSIADLEQVAKCTENVAGLLEKATHVRVTSHWGTDLTMQLGHRPALRIHPLNPVSAILPAYAEAAVSPLEGTGKGVVVISQMLGWGYVFEKPLQITVVGGRAQKVNGESEDVARLTQVIATDENASNFPAEFAIGTSHLVQMGLRGMREDAGRVGNVHIALGRNDLIHGTVWSRIHEDGLVTGATVELDGRLVIKDGQLLVNL
jgi:leucyl aminopeptidase (aminopeptidase T)